MNTVRFIKEDESEAVDIVADFDCLFVGRSIGAPIAKSRLVSLPYRNLLVNAYNRVTSTPVFDGRTIKLDFLYHGKKDKPQLISELYEALQGKANWWIEFDDDIGFWYKAYVINIDNVEHKNYAVKFSIICECSPFKYDRISTLAEWEWDPLDLENGVINDVGEVTLQPGEYHIFHLYCRKKRAYPTITTDQPTRVFVSGGSIDYSIPAGTTSIYEGTFREGRNLITLQNLSEEEPAKITIYYRGESL